MRLVDLRPRWFAEEGRHGQGLTFDCPCCVGRPDAVRLAVAFVPALDGGPPCSLKISKLVPVLWPPPATGPGHDICPPGIHWQRTGETLETLTLSPSIDASTAGHWHGFVTRGEVR
jgi:hypothetical protein